jgi:methanethiol S-methyltransferase
MMVNGIIILMAFALYGTVHSILASLGAKRLVERWFGTTGQRLYRLFFNFIALVTILPLVTLPVLLPDKTIYAIPWPWSMAALIGQGLGLLGLMVGVLQTGLMNFIGFDQLIDPVGNKTTRHMTTNGLYSIVRHPLYTSGMLLLWLTPIMTWNFLAFNLGASIYMFLGAAFFEEKKLREEFGEQYITYQKTVPMLIPGIKPRK